MTAEGREGRRRRGRAARRLLGCAAGALLLAGCASMPGSGDVHRVDSAQRPEGDGQVRVFGVPPEEGAVPQEIVLGFLEATTSDEADFATARQYLTPQAQDTWRPLASTTVLRGSPLPTSLGGEQTDDGESRLFEVTGTRLATVDEGRVFHPDDETYRGQFRLRLVDGEWRINELPDGLVLAEEDFRRNYRTVDTYFFADAGAAAAEVPRVADTLVPDPVFVRSRVDPVGEAVSMVLRGPSEWLAPVVRSYFPASARPAGDQRLTVTEAGLLSVRLTGVPEDLPAGRCERMAAQVLFTVRDLGVGEPGVVELADEDGSRHCSLTESEALNWRPGLLVGSQDRQYFLNEDRRLVSVGEEADQARVVPGPLQDAQLRSVAVSRDEELAAGVSVGGAELYVAGLTGSEPLPEPVHVTEPGGEGPGADGNEGENGSENGSGGEDPGGEEPETEPGGLSTPGWDGLGDLWFADRGGDPGLYRIPGGTGEAVPVTVEGLRASQRIEEVRPASDGVRIALLLSRGDKRTLYLGRVERTPAAGAAEAGSAVEAARGTDHVVTVRDLRPVTPHLDNVTAAAWAGDSRLVVVGRPADGVEQLQFVSTDGAAVNTPSLPGLGEVTGVAASEEEKRPLLAEVAEGVVRQRPDGQWQILAPGGSDPVYPG
ncbi:LpqB family beta-propeller domain-containing protein [Streptomyces aidingensis]|uniref:Lipoprotein LpqB beta-propeller domain-containing protein n=1 Tax=Streptomyces aidingensis TaxID=910347 RepID=A0A1I1DWV9_9ACTN|nr:LpqB family beta-propeller domain-containing protein [Streptomyces aidingensis]SFB79307.1 Lipoprotein LpqB beta-propeller domain-containing protein [Streptomyces aidingensis]